MLGKADGPWAWWPTKPRPPSIKPFKRYRRLKGIPLAAFAIFDAPSDLKEETLNSRVLLLSLAQRHPASGFLEKG